MIVITIALARKAASAMETTITRFSRQRDIAFFLVVMGGLEPNRPYQFDLGALGRCRLIFSGCARRTTKPFGGKFLITTTP